jgi:hypothetical protein
MNKTMNNNHTAGTKYEILNVSAGGTPHHHCAEGPVKCAEQILQQP